MQPMAVRGAAQRLWKKTTNSRSLDASFACRCRCCCFFVSRCHGEIKEHRRVVVLSQAALERLILRASMLFYVHLGTRRIESTATGSLAAETECRSACDTTTPPPNSSVPVFVDTMAGATKHEKPACNVLLSVLWISGESDASGVLCIPFRAKCCFSHIRTRANCCLDLLCFVPLLSGAVRAGYVVLAADPPWEHLFRRWVITQNSETAKTKNAHTHAQRERATQPTPGNLEPGQAAVLPATPSATSEPCRTPRLSPPCSRRRLPQTLRRSTNGAEGNEQKTTKGRSRKHTHTHTNTHWSTG